MVYESSAEHGGQLRLTINEFRNTIFFRYITRQSYRAMGCFYVSPGIKSKSNRLGPLRGPADDYQSGPSPSGQRGCLIEKKYIVQQLLQQSNRLTEEQSSVAAEQSSN